MQRNIIETVMGGVVLIVAVFFVAFAFSSAGVRSVSGYEVSARFENASGLSPGTDVRMSGVKIGSVTEQSLDPETFSAVVVMTIQGDLELPLDTSARVIPDGLLGGNFVELEPGGELDNIEPGGSIEYTQGAINIIDLATRLFFSTTDGGESGEGGDAGDGGAAGGAGGFGTQQ